MPITLEMEEILHYLHAKDNYALFAGFAAFLHTGVEVSPDIDVFVSSLPDVAEIADEFIKKGWHQTRHPTDTLFLSTVKKGTTTFDILFSEPAQKVLLPRKIPVDFQGYHLFTISLEGLLLTKMNQVASMGRSDDKTQRDRKVIHIVRQKIDVKKLRSLLLDLEDSFWTKGYF
jgi:hypothetical protein